ncbi:hypothetical protein [uncultured Pontibacter sp.]|uniref:hypothetical protein n=1 Tax=uncultured Pontibacter sp. TaxID=453356 RepID=UPI002601F803|nr:hypothetical protein [uncultured Pontibacter sp.]
MSYLNSTFGGVSADAFGIPGINRLALIEKSKITGYTGGDNVTAIAVTTGAKFQEIFFTEDSANYTQELTSSASAKYITQTLNFRVESDEIAKAHSVILGRQYVALVKKSNGKWVVLGQTNGLRCTAATANSTEDDATLSFTLTAKNLGYGSNVTMTDTALDALINVTATV